MHFVNIMLKYGNLKQLLKRREKGQIQYAQRFMTLKMHIFSFGNA